MWQQILESLAEALRLATFQPGITASKPKPIKEGNPGCGRKDVQAKPDSRLAGEQTDREPACCSFCGRLPVMP
jgi:hypothetical protein